MHDFSILDYSIMGIISFVTAGVSAATGMGGGMIFLIGLNLFLPLNSVIPVHGLIQLKNNAVRVFVLRSHLKKDICILFTVGCLLGVVIVTYFLSSLDNKLLPYTLILLLVLYSLFKPKRMPELTIPDWGFGVLGFFTGIIGILIGAVDPLLAPFFLRKDFTRHEVIANKSYFQSLVHLSKTPVFLFLGFQYQSFFTLIIILVIAGMLGTFIGIKILDRINQNVFLKVFKIILFAVSLKVSYNIYIILN